MTGLAKGWSCEFEENQPQCAARPHPIAYHSSTPRAVSAEREGNSSTDPPKHMFVGAYTPVTKNLWKQRLKDRGIAPADAKLPPIMEKRPERIAAKYSFTTDHEMCEMVRLLCESELGVHSRAYMLRGSTLALEYTGSSRQCLQATIEARKVTRMIAPHDAGRFTAGSVCSEQQ
jgi:hypothetical protein